MRANTAAKIPTRATLDGRAKAAAMNGPIAMKPIEGDVAAVDGKQDRQARNPEEGDHGGDRLRAIGTIGPGGGRDLLF